MFSYEKNDLNQNKIQTIASKKNKNTQSNDKQNLNVNNTSKKIEGGTDGGGGGKINSGFLTDSSTGSNDPVDVIYALPTRKNIKRPNNSNNPVQIEATSQLNKITNAGILEPNSIFIEGIDYVSKSNRKNGASFPLNKKIKTKKSQFNLAHYPILYLPLIVCFLLIFLCIVAGVTFFIIRNEKNVSTNTSLSEFNWWYATKTTVLLNSTSNFDLISYFFKTTTSTTTMTSSINDYVNSTIVIVNDSHNKFSNEKCGYSKNRPRSKQYRIMKGNQALPRAWPWAVSIGFYGPKASLAHACGGALINKRFLLTASHCVIE